MTPEQLAECRRKADLPGSGTLSLREYHQHAGQLLQAEIDGETPPVPVLREGGFGLAHTSALEARAVERWPAVAAAMAWEKEPALVGRGPEHPFLLLCGPSEAGKTTAAAVAAARWVRRCVGPRATGQARPVVLFSVARLSTVPTWEIGPMLEEAHSCRFLVLDDLGAEALKADVCAALFALLDARWSARRRTVVSANLKPEALHHRLDWGNTEPPHGQVGRTWRRLSSGWVATVSRAMGTLEVGGEQRPFPAFEAPKRNRGGTK